MRGKTFHLFLLTTNRYICTNQTTRMSRLRKMTAAEIAAAEKNGTTAEGTATVAGLWYQWGRKDPFRHNVAPTKAGGPTTTAVAIENPTTFYTHSSSPYDWRSGQNDQLWGNNKPSVNPNTDRGIKTMYDPCPVGWKVAPQDLWNSVVSGGYKTTYLSINNAKATRNGAQTEIRYYSAGYLSHSTGLSRIVAQNGYYWSSSPFAGNTVRWKLELQLRRCDPALLLRPGERLYGALCPRSSESEQIASERIRCLPAEH